MEEKLLEVATNLLLPGQKSLSQFNALESGVRLSDDAIIGFLEKYDKKTLKTGLMMGEGLITAEIKKSIPNISDESVKRIFELAEAKVNGE